MTSPSTALASMRSASARTKPWKSSPRPTRPGRDSWTAPSTPASSGLANKSSWLWRGATVPFSECGLKNVRVAGTRLAPSTKQLEASSWELVSMTVDLPSRCYCPAHPRARYNSDRFATGRVLKAMWNPDNGAPSDEEKARIHHEINAAFNQAGHTAVYSARKLGDAISNRMYTWRLAQRQKIPQSWAAGARANRRKRNLEEANNTRAEKDTEKKDTEEGMVTPRGTASLIDGCACDAEMFGLPVVTDDFACTVEVPTLPTDLEVSTEISTVSTTIDDSWNVFATLDSTDLLPSPPTSPMQSPTPMEEAGASMCGTDMTYNVASDCACSAAAPLDDLDLLLERAQVYINLDGIELCDLDCVSVEQPVDEPQSVAIPGRTKAPVHHNRPTSQFNESTVGFENEFDNSGLARAFMTDKLKGSRTSSSEPP